MVLDESSGSWKARVKSLLTCKWCKCPKVECKMPEGLDAPWTALWRWWKGLDKKWKRLFWIALAVVVLLAVVVPLLLSTLAGREEMPAALDAPSSKGTWTPEPELASHTS